MARVISLADFRPSPRSDGQPWSQVRLEQSDAPTEGWETVSIHDLEPLDEDPDSPSLRGVTGAVAKAWARLVFVDADAGEDPQAAVFTDGPSFRPTLAEVSAILRARTYSGKHPDPDDPMAVIAGGVLLGEFSNDTTPTASDVEERIIPAATNDVSLALGRVPGELLGAARRAAALRVAGEIERSFIPEQSEEGKATLYGTLYATYRDECDQLARTLQWWVLANGRSL